MSEVVAYEAVRAELDQCHRSTQQSYIPNAALVNKCLKLEK